MRILTRYSAYPVVYVVGRIVGDDASILKSVLLELADRGYAAICLDLSKSPGIDAAGIGTLLAARGRLVQMNGKLILVNCSADLSEDLQHTGMLDLFEQYPRLEDIPMPA